MHIWEANEDTQAPGRQMRTEWDPPQNVVLAAVERSLAGRDSAQNNDCLIVAGLIEWDPAQNNALAAIERKPAWEGLGPKTMIT